MNNVFRTLAQGAKAIIALSLFVFVFVPGAHAALLTQQLDFGMRNADVTSLQTFLAANPSLYPQGIVSGYFGSLTRAAVARFQTANGLPAVGRVGPLTLAAINAQMGGSVSTPTGDVSAPLIFPETVTKTGNSATISWTTSEAARSRVMYGNSWPFLYSTAPSASASGFNSTANITLTGLQPNSTYYYVLESIDASGNVMWTVGKPVVTTQ